MLAKELLLLRREYLNICAATGAELKKEFEALEELYQRNLAVEANIKEAGGIEQLKLEAETYVTECHRKADRMLADIQNSKDKLETELTEVKLQREELQASKEAHMQQVSQHTVTAAEHHKKIKDIILTHDESARELARLTADIKMREEAVKLLEQELQTKLAKLREISA
jgi:hypothetical protein